MSNEHISKQPSVSLVSSRIHDATQYHWIRDEANKRVIPLTVPSDVQLAPPEILGLLRCGCTSDKPCYTARCGCVSAYLSCTFFCACQGEIRSGNEFTKREDIDDDDHIASVDE